MCKSPFLGQYPSLTQEEQPFAEVLLHDIQSNNITLDPTKTFRDYITEYYMVNNQEKEIEELVNALGLNKELLMEIIKSNATSKDLDQFGRFSSLIKSINIDKSKAYLEEKVGRELEKPMVMSKVDELLRNFILDGKVSL